MHKRIFVSHSSADKEIVSSFVDEILIGGLGYNPNHILYTSGEGMGIESGVKWREFLREGLLTVDVIILIITPNYKSSEICMNEMGASWATDAKVYPMIIEPISYKTVGVLAEVKQVEKLNSSFGLDHIYESLTKIFTEVDKPKQARWTTQKSKFLNQVEKYLIINPFQKSVSKDTILKLEEELNELKMVNITLLDDNEKTTKYIKVLESKKDTEDIKISKKEAGLLSKVKEFEAVLVKVNKILQKFDSPIVTFIYNDFTKRELEVDFSLYNREIQLGIANEYIDEDYSILWNKTNEMKKLQESLDSLNKCIDNLDEDSYNVLLDDYESLEIMNLSFWKNVLKSKIVT